MRVEWTPFALNDRINNFYYIASDNIPAAIKVDEAIKVSTVTLIEFPNIGRNGRLDGTRELVVTGQPYVIIYRVERDAVRILRVLHNAQCWPDTEAH